MILISTSKSVREKFRVEAVDTTAVVPSNDWHRFWRVDIRRVRGVGDVVLFSNYETLYTFVSDARRFRGRMELIRYFVQRYKEVLPEHILRNEKIEDEIAFHIVMDRSVQGVMNSFFLDIEAMVGRAFGDMEVSLNGTPIGSRGFRLPSELLRERLKKMA